MIYTDLNYNCHYLNSLRDRPQRPPVNSAIGPEYPQRIFGGSRQEERMIRDKRKSLDRALLYSYQAGWIKPLDSELASRALINPNKLKQDYDDKIVSAGYEVGLKPGTIFDWQNTGTKWIVYLQDLTEYAYFRGDIRRCRYLVEWKDKDTGDIKSTYMAVRGPVETKINYIQKQQISVDEPNHSLNILMPSNEDTLKYFKRYARFYMQGLDTKTEKICWRVEAIDPISTPGILEVIAVEYYSNEFRDDMENDVAEGIVIDTELAKSEDNNKFEIKGETFIKPRKTYTYTCDVAGDWSVDKDIPVKLEVSQDKMSVNLNWRQTISGQFDLKCGDYVKTIVVESLF